MRHNLGTVALVACLFATPLLADELEIARDESVLAIVTRKAGLAAGLAHDHLVVAAGYRAHLVFDPASPLDTRFEFLAKAADLVIDSPELKTVWSPRLEELGILSEPFEEMSEKDRAKVRDAMLGRKQLDAERFPEITGSILRVERADETDATFPYRVTIAFEAHGTRVEHPVRARFEETGNRVVLEVVGDFRFTDFGIKPYSAFLGAVKNRDEFRLYVRVVAVSPPESSSPGP